MADSDASKAFVRKGVWVRIPPLALWAMRSSLIVLCTLLAGCCSTHLKGTVVDGKGRPVAAAYIGLKGVEGEVETDAEGKFTVEVDCREAPYLVRITAPGFEFLGEEVVLKDSEVKRTFTVAPAKVLTPKKGTDKKNSAKPAKTRGPMVKCPDCGERIPKGTVPCPTCGGNR